MAVTAWRALSHSRKRRGFVLVSVLMLGVLLISCATTFTWFVRQQVRGISHEASMLSGRSMAHVIVNAIISMLSEATNRVNYDSPTQRWYQPFVLAVPDMGIWVVRITPLDDKIPLRNLFLPDGNTMRREFTDVWRDMWDKLKHRELEQLVLDFMDRNNKPRVGSVEREDFVNRPLYDISELLLMSHDINAEILYGYEGLLGISDYCTVYSDGKINLNVAPVHVMELLPGLDVGGLAQSIADYRAENAIESLRDIQKIPGASARTSTRLTNIAGFKSRYFSIKIDCMSTESESVSSYSAIFDRTTKQLVRWEES